VPQYVRSELSVTTDVDVDAGGLGDTSESVVGTPDGKPAAASVEEHG
jgi:hypothetical protein